MISILDHRVTQTEFAALMGIDPSTVSRLISDGCLAESGTCLHWLRQYTNRLREQAAGRMGAEVGGLDLAQERAALAREQRMGIEIKNSVLRGEFAPIALLSEVLATASQSVVERFEQLPSILKKSCPDLPDAAREQVMIALAAARNEWVRATESLVLARATVDQDNADDELLQAPAASLLT
jgi:phage terminase Nu1 subunit (DNA packaging protein)